MNDRSDQIAAHEVMTPLHAIDGAAELLLDGSVAQLPLEARDVVALIARSSRELNGKIGLLLAYIEILNRPAAYRPSHPLSELLRIAGCEGGTETGANVELALPDFSRAISILRDECGLSGPAAMAEPGDQVRIELGQLSCDLQTGNGSIAFNMARELVQQNEGRLEQEAGLVVLSVPLNPARA